jgi:hypothetical protein
LKYDLSRYEIKSTEKEKMAPKEKWESLQEKNMDMKENKRQKRK